LKESKHSFFGSELIELTDKKCHSHRVRGHLLSHWQAAQRVNVLPEQKVRIGVVFT
jgi:hypothetical protein